MAAPVLGLRYLLAEAGIDLERDNVTIVPPPATIDGRWMGHAGAEAIRLGLADAYWGNGMRLAIGEKLGVAESISTFAAATVRREPAGTASRR